jgi:hypothetical protein
VALLVAAGAIQQVRKLLHTQHHITDPSRAGRARARLDSVTWAEACTDLAAAAMGGLARAAGLDKQIYSGRAYRSRHRELGGIGTQRCQHSCLGAMPLWRARWRR